MTQQESKAADRARLTHEALIAFSGKTKTDDWVLAAMLYKLRRLELWRFAVGGYDSWEDYLKQPEINMSRHKADKLVRIYEHFVVLNNYTPQALQDVPWSALDYISKKKAEVQGDDLGELLESAKHLTLKDFKETFFEVTDGGDRSYTFLVMRKCDQTGNLEKVHDITSDQIKTAFNL